MTSKIVYDGESKGLYESITFKEFIDKIKCEEGIESLGIHIFGRSESHYNWYSDKNNVVIRGIFKYEHKPDKKNTAKIELKGKEEDMSKVEKIILTESLKHESPKGLAEVL